VGGISVAVGSGVAVGGISVAVGGTSVGASSGAVDSSVGGTVSVMRTPHPLTITVISTMIMIKMEFGRVDFMLLEIFSFKGILLD
jgi:hypothetical protein